MKKLAALWIVGVLTFIYSLSDIHSHIKSCPQNPERIEQDTSKDDNAQQLKDDEDKEEEKLRKLEEDTLDVKKIKEQQKEEPKIAKNAQQFECPICHQSLLLTPIQFLHHKRYHP